MTANHADSYHQLEDLSQEDLVRYLLNMSHRMNIHHTLWFRETEHQLGMERALDLLEEVTEQSSRIEMQRLGKTLGFEVEDGIPKVFLDLPRETLLQLTAEFGKNWLATDGLWFQAIERAYGMNAVSYTHLDVYKRQDTYVRLALNQNQFVTGLKVF